MVKRESKKVKSQGKALKVNHRHRIVADDIHNYYLPVSHQVYLVNTQPVLRGCERACSVAPVVDRSRSW